MPKRLTYVEIKNMVKELTDGAVKLVSTEYINNRTPLEFECFCGNHFFRKWDKFRLGQRCCPSCSEKHASNMLKLNIDYVIAYINNHGCEYVSGNYDNDSSKLVIRCSCGQLFNKSFAKFRSGQTRCNDCAKKIISEKKKKYDYDNAYAFLKQYGYTLIDPIFKGAAEKHLCLCKNNHECQIVLSQLKVGRSGCMVCMRMAQKGENSHFYKDGSMTAQESLRASLGQWKKSIQEYYNNSCPITDNPVDLCDVHHLKSIKTIYHEVCLDYGVDYNIQAKLKDFSSYELFDRIKQDVLSKHTLDIGILISKEIHREFHKQYGKETTVEQFNEFLQNNYNTSLSKIKEDMRNG